MIKIFKRDDKWIVDIDGKEQEFRFESQAAGYIHNIYGAAKIMEMAIKGTYIRIK